MEQNDITSPFLRQQRDRNKWTEHRKKGDNIHQHDRQQSQQTVRITCQNSTGITRKSRDDKKD